MKLTRFWIRFRSNSPGYNPSRLGCGVTAYSHDDALAILSNTIFKGKDLPPVDEVIENVDVSCLDQNHVIPNIEPPVWRGVWFPRGFASPR
jgi:hypothetical protein